MSADTPRRFAIRKILLPLQTANTAEAVCSTAALTARMWAAHVAVLHVGSNKDRANSLRDQVTRVLAQHGLAVTDTEPDGTLPKATFTVVTGQEPEIVAQQARLTDLVVVPHPASDKEVSSSDALHAALFDSAKPILIAPAAAPSAIGRRICVGWNGTAESASAVLAALPWLERAEAIRILWSEDYQRRGPLAPELQQYLAMHDITTDRAAFAPEQNAVGAGLLAAANDFDCDLLVMGAYSHSRLRQLFLGGVTRHVLERAKIPVLMHR
jgi:nucleotide-binding universal stress UspA family protein